MFILICDMHNDGDILSCLDCHFLILIISEDKKSIHILFPNPT